MPKNNVLDEKSRKILVQLDQNARQTDAGMAKAVGLSKQVVNYRIQQLHKAGIVTSIYTIVNVGKLGLDSYYLFFQLENINKKQEEELLKKISVLDYIGWLVSGTGRWDVVMLVYANSVSAFDRFLSQIIAICGEHLHEYNFTTLIAAEHIGYKFLAETRDLHSAKQTEKVPISKLDAQDRRILAAIDQNARMPVVKIAENAELPVHVVSYRLKNMIKQNIIEGFKPKINVNKLGRQWHLLLIQFKQTAENRKRAFISFCRAHKKIYYVTNTLGLYNLMLDIHLKTAEEFKEILLELKEKFSDLIKLYESIVIFDEYKISYFPKELI